jgi:hypothetical protein
MALPFPLKIMALFVLQILLSLLWHMDYSEGRPHNVSLPGFLIVILPTSIEAQHHSNESLYDWKILRVPHTSSIVSIDIFYEMVNGD